MVKKLASHPMNELSQRSPSTPCPLCLRGAIATMPMMDCLACDFCNHIFILEQSADQRQQFLRMADTISLLRWVWKGNRWQNANAEQVYTGRWLGVLGLLLVIVPTLITSLAAYVFAPQPDVPLAWFPKFWAIATFCGHLFVLLAIVRDYTQFPLRAYGRSMWRSLRGALRDRQQI